MDTKNTIDIFGMLEAKTLDGILALAQQIYDKGNRTNAGEGERAFIGERR